MEGVLVGQAGGDAHFRVVLLEELDEAGNGDGRHFRVKALFVAGGGIGAVGEADAALADGRRVERGGFQRQARRVIDNFAVQTAHDACDGNRLVAVADHQRVRVDGALHLVQRLEREALREAADADLLHLAAVEGVHRLPHFQHQIVRQVGKEVDVAHTAVVQADTHRHRADVAVDVLHPQAGVALAQRVFNLHVDGGQIVVRRQIRHGQGFQRTAGQGGEFARHAVVPPQVGTVRQGLVVHLEDDVVNGVERLQIRAAGNILRDDHDAGIVVADADFLLRAAHAVGRVPGELARADGDVAQLRAHLRERGFHAQLHVRRAADHVGQLPVARVHLQQVQLVGFGVILYADDLRGDNAGQIRALVENFILNFRRGQGELANQRHFVKTRQVNEVGNPVH